MTPYHLLLAYSNYDFSESKIPRQIDNRAANITLNSPGSKNVTVCAGNQNVGIVPHRTFFP
ncbi:hypothetical protein [Peptostreptococcus stomatis]|uniref:hypothetical protein n=1 Tax=Peptostreptococcus stomatis TaxID=341694 RepID=UPI0028EAF100|nr:hypothetical protein [Peptostreptococcus stomatis]